MGRGRPVKILSSPRPIRYAPRWRDKLRTRRADALSHKKKAPSRIPLGAAELSPQLRLLAKRRGVGGMGAAQLNPARQYDTQRPKRPCVGHHQKYESDAALFVCYHAVTALTEHFCQNPEIRPRPYRLAPSPSRRLRRTSTGAVGWRPSWTRKSHPLDPTVIVWSRRCAAITAAESSA